MGLMERIHDLREELEDRYARLSRSAKMVLWCWAGLNITFLGFLIIVGPDQLFRVLSRWADRLRDAPFGWLTLIIATILTSIPPLMGYSTCVTLCGFAFGVGGGWPIALAGSLLGAATAFTLCRHAIQRFMPDLDQQPAFRGLGGAVRQKGLKLIMLIRLCPIPYGYSNGFFASIETVSLPQFLLATLVVAPKLLLYVWIGERMYQLADPISRRQMDSTTKIANILSIVFGTIVGTFTGWYVWRLVRQEMERSAVMLHGEFADESQLLERGEAMADAEGDEDDVEGDDGDVDAIERRLVAEGHISRDHVNGRASTDRWSNDGFSDFGDDGGSPRELNGTPQISISAPTPVAERLDPLIEDKLK